MSDWIEWSGGDRPVDEDTLVEVRYAKPPVAAKGIRLDGHIRAGRLAWYHDGEDDDIVAYREVAA